MEVYRRRTAPWVWAVIVGIVGIALLVIVWLVGAQSAREEQMAREQLEERALEDETAQRPEEETTERVIIRDRERVREVVREKPVYVYIERPERQQETPAEVVVVPQDSEAPGARYERVDMPAEFSFNGQQFVIDPGDVLQFNSEDVVSTGKRADGRTIYYEKGSDPQTGPLYLRLRPDSDLYIRYEQVIPND
ncbi:MAG: hypothetical protein HYX78_08240 [Armatimonadetes bacterium]|nr:hypothetical protein [Armatimonadota bacterium]